ncbi:hypothetical protein CTZ27_09740 [Streptomyces griseocarneus]|nr:hypothetical protein CTZ27_09740 [Streptomyces griseocarneus]
MVTPRPLVPSPPVVSLPLSSAIGSIHYVDCPACVSLLQERDGYRKRGDEIDAALTDHCAKRHMQGEAPAWVPGLGDFAVDTSVGDGHAGEVIGWDGEEVILRLPDDEEPRRTTGFRPATQSEALSAKLAFRNRQGKMW